MTAEPRIAEAALFPRDRCVGVAAELSAWTSVQAILSAARHLEGRSLPTDQIDGRLIMPMQHGELFEAVFLRAVSWLSAGYSPPRAKIALARSLDPRITDETANRLVGARFSPNIKAAPLSAFDRSAPPPPAGPNAFLVDDEPFVIEMLQAPLQCLMGILTFSYESAEQAYKVRREAEERTGTAPTIYHRPFADSRLYATLEALCYYAFGLSIGPYVTPQGLGELDVSYRAVNVRSRPPVHPLLTSTSRTAMQDMLNGLRKARTAAPQQRPLVRGPLVGGGRLFAATGCR